MLVTVIALELPEKVVKRLNELSKSFGKSLEELVAEAILEYVEILDPDTKAELHLRLCEKYLREAEEFLSKGDYVQASEKAWGAAAQIVKAVAAKRGLELKSHGDLWKFVTKLVEEMNDAELRRLWYVANGLHINFYEAWATPEMVKGGVEDIKQFTEKLRKLIQ